MAALAQAFNENVDKANAVMFSYLDYAVVGSGSRKQARGERREGREREARGSGLGARVGSVVSSQ